MSGRVVVLTGAGISADSGLATFRGAGGLWEGHAIEEVATPEGWRRDPSLVWRFYQERRASLASVEPNAAHRALVALEAQLERSGIPFTLVTQNVDDLHERAGSRALLHMHGELASGWCLACGDRFAWSGPMGEAAACPSCGATGEIRPDIVWFGEMPYEMERIEDAIRACDLFVSIGTSGAVYPAAGFVQTARYGGAKTLEINLEPSLGSYLFDESRLGKASVEVPKWVEEMLAA